MSTKAHYQQQARRTALTLGSNQKFNKNGVPVNKKPDQQSNNAPVKEATSTNKKTEQQSNVNNEMKSQRAQQHQQHQQPQQQAQQQQSNKKQIAAAMVATSAVATATAATSTTINTENATLHTTNGNHANNQENTDKIRMGNNVDDASKQISNNGTKLNEVNQESQERQMNEVEKISVAINQEINLENGANGGGGSTNDANNGAAIVLSEVSKQRSAEEQKSAKNTDDDNKAIVEKTGKSEKTTPEKNDKKKEKKIKSPRKKSDAGNNDDNDDDDDVEMEPLVLKESPSKVSILPKEISFATSTPGKIINKRNAGAIRNDLQLAMQITPSEAPFDYQPRNFSQIAGRRSIHRNVSQFDSNMLFRESYRRINTELDVSGTTNTSLNVTVGSEIPNNSSFSFFGRGRKRDRTPTKSSQSAIELQNETLSPPKRARFETFLSVVSSPITLLRSRFAKTSIQSSTPMKLAAKLEVEPDQQGEDDVQNVSGLSIAEEISAQNESVNENLTTSKDAEQKPDAKNNESEVVTEVTHKGDVSIKTDDNTDSGKNDGANENDLKVNLDVADKNDDDDKVEIASIAVGSDTVSKKRCIVM